MEDHLLPGVKEVADDLFMITLPMPFRLAHVNVYALIDGDGLSLFDTGGNFPGTFDILEEYLRKIGFSVTRVRRVFVTHFHADHCGIAGLIKEKSGASVLMSETDFGGIRSLGQEGTHLGLLRTFCLEQGLDNGTAETVAGIFRSFKDITWPFQADAYLKDGLEVTVGDKTVRVVATPGHTSGHCSFFIPEGGILVAGDSILPHITPNLSIDLLSPAFRPLKSFIESLEKMSRFPVDTAYPAHGLPFQDLHGRAEEIKAHHRERKALTLRALEGRPKTAAEVSLVVFGNDLPEFDRLLALNETYVHLMELEHEGVIRRYRQGEKDVFAFV